MIGAKITVAKYCAELKIATAVPSPVPGTMPQLYDYYWGKEGALLKPTRNRNVNNATIMPKPLKISTKPCSRVNMDQIKMDQK